MSRYERLGSALKGRGQEHIAMSFAEIEQVLGSPLPRSAYRHRAWWANDATGHSHAKAWLEAGFKTEQVDMAGGTVVFVRALKEAQMENAMAESKAAFEPQSASKPRSIVGALKGMARIAPGVDITKPALDPEEWEEILERKYGPKRKD